MPPEKSEPNCDETPGQDDKGSRIPAKESGSATPLTAKRHEKPENALQLILWLLDKLGLFKWPALILALFVFAVFAVWKALPAETQQNIINWGTRGYVLAAGYYPSVFVESERSVLDLSEWSPDDP